MNSKRRSPTQIRKKKKQLKAVEIPHREVRKQSTWPCPRKCHSKPSPNNPWSLWYHSLCNRQCNKSPGQCKHQHLNLKQFLATSTSGTWMMLQKSSQDLIRKVKSPALAVALRSRMLYQLRRGRVALLLRSPLGKVKPVRTV